MNCHRCGGLMLAEQFDDPHDYTNETEFVGWRCVNCGSIVDPVITGRQRRQSDPSPVNNPTHKEGLAMVRTVLLALSACVFLLSAQPLSAAPQPDPGFAPLKFLVGKWRGTDPEGQPITAFYRFTSGATSLTETLSPKKSPAMTTIYHLDGAYLMLTHYCSLNNQPRMRVNEYKEGDKELAFDFLDATNLKNPSDPHMHKVVFTFHDNDHYTQTWMFSKDGTETPKVFKFERVK